MSLRNNGTKDNNYQHSGTHFAELAIMFQNMYSKIIQNYKLATDVCDIIMVL